MYKTDPIAYIDIKKWAQVLAAIAFLAGCCGLSGWLFNSEFLKSFLSDGASMKVNTALLLIFAAASYLTLHTSLKALSPVLAGLVILLSVAILAEHLLNVDLAIDQFWLKDRATDRLLEAPGRTSLLTAINALLIGTALYLLFIKQYWVSQLMVVCVLVIVYLSLIGHLFHISGFYHLGKYSGVAFNTAIGLLSLAGAILFGTVDQGWVQIVYVRAKRNNRGFLYAVYLLGASPLLAAMYLFVTRYTSLDAPAKTIVLITLTGLVCLPLAYFLLKLVSQLGDELKESDNKLEIALEAARLGSYELVLESGLMLCTAQCTANFGHRPDATFNFADLMQSIVPAYRETVQECIEKAVAERSTYSCEYQVEWPDGSLHWISASGRVIYDGTGKAGRMVGVTLEITQEVESKKSLEDAFSEMQSLNEELATANEELAAGNEELTAINEELLETQHQLETSMVQELAAIEQLKASELLSRDIVAAAPFPIGVYKGREMRIVMANQAMIDVWGKGQDIIGRTYHEVLPELAGQDIYSKLDEVFTTGQPYHARNQRVDLFVNARIQPFYFNYSFTPLTDEHGHIFGVMNTAAEISDIVLISERLAQSEHNLKEIIEQAPVAICILEGPQHVITVANHLIVELWGKPEQEVMNKPVFEALPDARGQGLEEVMREVYETGKTFYANEMPVALTRYGEQQTVFQNFVYQAFYTADRQIAGVIAITIDVTEQVVSRQKIEASEKELKVIQKRLEEELTVSRQLQSQKDDFIGMTSHELKTPLTSLQAIIQVTQSKLKNSEDKFLNDAMTKAVVQVKRMSAMINGFLNVSRLESGKIAIEKENFNIDQLVEEVISEVKLTIASHTIELVPCAPLTVYADRDKITSVISNLVNNAVKYSPLQTTITVTCQARPDDVRIQIIDQGMGIEKADTEKIFDRYYRVQKPNMKFIAGFGIGLYLSAEIVHKHDGQIGVESEPGKGSTFWFTLPNKS
ncbi:PAS domain S-box-containing protein [Mucilaginibacter pineti]|uniref:histidine kinase n=1 Tax=Mucilaginibacter pineti TaxID=1391627 RepID=A0A1G7C7U1_9SPHI|nr:ATP-binding protein [Mucilaginibacter pineti]SDE35401.1 PAS domain S-box-containing protein [Mucilaginibacter pineti]